MRRHVHKYIIPGWHNNYKPHLLRPKTSFFIALAIGALFVTTHTAQYAVQSGVLGNTAAVIASVLTDLTNGDRMHNGVFGLVQNPTLASAAQLKAEDMAARGYFAHNAPDGTEPWHWFEKVGYKYVSAGENLAVYFSDSVEVQKAWMNSPLHRANILNPMYTEVGIGMADGFYQGRATTFVVQLFGTPAIADVIDPEPLLAIAESTETIPEPVEEKPQPKPRVRKNPVVLAKSDTAIVVSPTQEPTVAGTSTQEVVASIAATARPLSSSTGLYLWKLFTSPRTIMSLVYFWTTVLVLLVLMLLVGIEAERRHWTSMACGIGLLTFMISLSVVEHWYLGGTLLIL